MAQDASEWLPEAPFRSPQTIRVGRRTTYNTEHIRSANPIFRIYNCTHPCWSQCSVTIQRSTTMKSFALLMIVVGAVLADEAKIHTGDNLVSSVLLECSDMSCIKIKVLNYLDTILGLGGDARNIQVIHNTHTKTNFKKLIYFL